MLTLYFLTLSGHLSAKQIPKGEVHAVSLSDNREWLWQRSVPEGDLLVWEIRDDGEKKLILKGILECLFCEGDEDNCDADGIQVHELAGYPHPVFVVVGHVGAHSQQILIFDPVKGNNPVFRETGSYFINYASDGKTLSISYDCPGKTECENQATECYVEQRITWPDGHRL